MVRRKNIIIISEQFLQRNQMFDYFSQTEFMISKGGGDNSLQISYFLPKSLWLFERFVILKFIYFP